MEAKREAAWKRNGRWNLHEIYSRRIFRERHARTIREFRYSTLSFNFVLWRQRDRFLYSDPDNATSIARQVGLLRATSSQGRRLILFYTIVQYHIEELSHLIERTQCIRMSRDLHLETCFTRSRANVSQITVVIIAPFIGRFPKSGMS